MAGKSLIFGDADRGPDGRLAIEPAGRSLADLLPDASPAAPSAPARPLPSRRVQAASAVLAVVVLAGAWLALRPTASAPAPRAVPTAAQAAAPTAAPAAAPASRAPSATATSGCQIAQTTATFYAPAGSPAPIAAERGQACHLVAWHALYPDWRQITIGGGEPVWVPLATLSEASTAGLPDLAPPPTATPAPATARPVVIIEQAPAPTPEPTRCATVRGGGTTVQRCGIAPLDQLQADAESAWREQMTPATPRR